MAFSRRQFLTAVGVSAASTALASPLSMLYSNIAHGRSSRGQGYGPLLPDPNGLLDLPAGFTYQAFSREGSLMTDGTLVPGKHDGMAAFPGSDRTTILVRNHELSPTAAVGVVGPNKYDPSSKGGTTTLIVGPDRKLIKDYASLAGTYRNCAGGPTPWGSWISCEENTSTPANDPNVTKKHGYNFEVPAKRLIPVRPKPLVEMGRFNHEAIAVDPRTGVVYQTEDRGDGLFYRFIPKQPGQLDQGGKLQALVIKGKPQTITKTGFTVGQSLPVEWVAIENPDPDEDTVRVEGFAKGAAQFSRGEGVWYSNNEIYFCCTNGGTSGFGQIWRYEPEPNPNSNGILTLFVESSSNAVLDAPDNITVAPYNDLFICEDGGGTQFVRGINMQGQVFPFARNALNDSEFAGVCFSTRPLTMFVNIQTPGITFAIWGPFI
ncbi:MAG: alkaline phosphatase PhoX [Thermosynechococcaceae cyanobacterium]